MKSEPFGPSCIRELICVCIFVVLGQTWSLFEEIYTCLKSCVSQPVLQHISPEVLNIFGVKD